MADFPPAGEDTSFQGRHFPNEPPFHPAILKKLAYLLSARWLRDLLQAVFFIVLARASAATFGEFMLALGWGGILLLGVEFGFNLPLVREISRGGKLAAELPGQVAYLKAGLVGLGLFITTGFSRWQGYDSQLSGVILVIFTGLGLEALAGTFFAALQAHGRQDLEARVKAMAAGVGFAYGLVALALGAPPVVVAFYKIWEAAVNIFGSIYGASRLGIRWTRPSWARLQSVARMGVVFVLLEMAAAAYNQANLFFLQQYLGPPGVAQYSAAWKVVDSFSSMVATLFLQSIMFPLFVRLGVEDSTDVAPLARDTVRWLVLLALPLMFLLWSESDRLILLIYGPQFSQAIWLQQCLVPTIIISFVHNLAVFLALARGWQAPLLAIYLGGLIFNLLWCKWVMPAFPLGGAVLAIILTKGVVALGSISLVWRQTRFFSGADFLALAGVASGGMLLYLAASPLAPRLAAEALALAPAAILGWRWWRWRRPGTFNYSPPW